SKSMTDLERNLLAATTAFLQNLSIPPQELRDQQADQIEQELRDRQGKSFPLDLFARSTLSAWTGNLSVLNHSIKNFLAERAKINEETRRLVDLFKAALSISELSDGHSDIDCPLCGTADALTRFRIDVIREQVKNTEAYQTAEKSIKLAVQEIDTSLSMLSDSLEGTLPKCLRVSSHARRKRGFTIARLRELVPDDSVVSEWVSRSRLMVREHTSLKKSIAVARTCLHKMIDLLNIWDDSTTLFLALNKVTAEQSSYEKINQLYGQASQSLAGPLKGVVEESTKTKGWDELIVLARNPARLWDALQKMAEYDLKIKNLDKALKEIDTGNGKVADEKFSEMSSDVKTWWDYLRPCEPTFFEAVQRRSTKARRNIDIKVGLAANEDRSNPKFRDAIAVFSQSQLHCLGLSMFLARSVQEKAGFIILDDPVLASDDDFRPNFASTVIEGLLNEGVQVIVLTQDHSSWKDIGHRWEHKNVAQFQIVRNDPVLGTEIRNQNDGLATMLAKASSIIKSHDIEQRKDGATIIRQAVERFGKELLVRKRCADGDSMASITDYDGKTFGEFSNSVYQLLTRDAAHPGKLRAAYTYVTPGPHDDTPPSTTQLSMALGDLKKLKRDYLD
ncbi:MAG TPA: hypothetical protein DCY07_00380, partial [Rhodospirillaceae bacterium]|nr:hypothetical protein [Rhodospirillaceae bacterium]